MHPSLRLLSSIFMIVILASASSTFARIELTEIDLGNGLIELTNVSGAEVLGDTLDWCIPFTYGALESGGFNFKAGETRVYDLGTGALSAADDLWIYQDRVGGFSATQFVESGIVWGADQSGQGRVDSVVTNTAGEAWALNTDFVSTTGLMAGQTLQMNVPALNPNSSTGWGIGATTLGDFGATTDVDQDGDVDCDDITALMTAVFKGGDPAFADLTGDGIVDHGDRDAWLREAGNYLPGDANFDGTVDGVDFLTWNSNKFQAVSDYCSADFDGSGFVDGGDFLIWNQNKFDSGPAVVPEPAAFLYICLFLMSMLALRRYKNTGDR